MFKGKRHVPRVADRDSIYFLSYMGASPAALQPSVSHTLVSGAKDSEWTARGAACSEQKTVLVRVAAQIKVKLKGNDTRFTSSQRRLMLALAARDTVRSRTAPGTHRLTSGRTLLPPGSLVSHTSTRHHRPPFVHLQSGFPGCHRPILSSH